MAPKPQESPVEEQKNQILTQDNLFNFSESFAKQTENFKKQVSEMKKRQSEFHQKFSQDCHSFLDDSSDVFFKENNDRWLSHGGFAPLTDFNLPSIESIGDHSSAVKEDENSYQITMDIKDFDPKKLKVKLIENNELLIEGNYEETTNGQTQKKEFKKSFCLPQVNEASNITCKRTSDGTLLINIQKDKNVIQEPSRTIPIIRNGSPNSSLNYESNKNPPSSNNVNSNGRFPDQFATSFPSHRNDMPEAAIKPRSIGTLHTHKGPEQVMDVNSQFYNSPSHESENKKQDSPYQQYAKDQSDSVEQLPSNLNRSGDPISNIFDIQPTDMGSFFDDSFFNDMHDDFHSAVKKVLKNSNRLSSNLIDDMNKYRDLRSFKKSTENQAVSHTEDNELHKIILDVKGFDKNSLSVKVAEDETLVIEGSYTDNTNGSSIRKTFKHLFKISDFNTQTISSALSQDGILTVKVPKKEMTSNHGKYTNRSSSLNEFEDFESQFQNLGFN